MIGGVGLVSSWVPKVVGPRFVLRSGRWGGGSEYCIKTSCPVNRDSGCVSDLLPSIRVWNPSVHFTGDEFPQASDEGSFGAFPFQMISCVVGHTDKVRDVLIDVVAFHM